MCRKAESSARDPGFGDATAPVRGRAAAPRIRRCVVALALATVSLAWLELGCRLEAYLDELRARAGWQRATSQARPAAGTVTRLADVVRPSSDPRRVYELEPDLDVHLPTRVVTNEAGFRGRPFVAAKAPRTVRVIGLGDSVMFGLGLEESEAFLARLGERLSAGHPSVIWETLNLAVPGYNTVNEVATLAACGLGYAPDVVVLHVVTDDLNVPKFIVRRSLPLALDHSFLMERLAWVGDSLPGRGSQLVESVRRRDGVRAAALTPGIRAMAGIAAFEDALAELTRLAHDHDFAVLAVAHEDLSPEIDRALRSARITTVTSTRLVAQYMNRNGIRDARDPRLVFSRTDPHPSALVHDLIAEALARHLARTGLADELAERALGGHSVARNAANAGLAGDQVTP